MQKDVRKLQRHALESREAQSGTEAAVRELAQFAAELEERFEDKSKEGEAVKSAEKAAAHEAASAVAGTRAAVDTLKVEVADCQARAF